MYCPIQPMRDSLKGRVSDHFYFHCPVALWFRTLPPRHCLSTDYAAIEGSESPSFHCLGWVSRWRLRPRLGGYLRSACTVSSAFPAWVQLLLRTIVSSFQSFINVLFIIKLNSCYLSCCVSHMLLNIILFLQISQLRSVRQKNILFQDINFVI